MLAGSGASLDEKNPQFRLFHDSLKAKRLPGTGMIEIKIRGYSREEARQWAETIFEKLHTIHAELAVPSIQRMKQQFG